MGCFSYLCKECGKPIICDQEREDPVYLFHLVGGEVVQYMHGTYTSYGTVINDEGKELDWNHEWGGIVVDHFDSDDSSGIAAIHEECYKGNFPDTRSEDDPNQGWLSDEDE